MIEFTIKANSLAHAKTLIADLAVLTGVMGDRVVTEFRPELTPDPQGELFSQEILKRSKPGRKNAADKAAAETELVEKHLKEKAVPNGKDGEITHTENDVPPTQEEVAKAAHALVKRKGLEAARVILESYGAQRPSEIKSSDAVAFIKKCYAAGMAE